MQLWMRIRVWRAKREWAAARAMVASARYELASCEQAERVLGSRYRLLRSRLDATLIAVAAGKEPKP